MKRLFKAFAVAVFLLFFLTACGGEKPFVVFSSSPITQKTQPQSTFKKGERIYYAAVAPKGFGDSVIKVQIFKQEDKTEFGGYSYRYNRTCELENDKYYTDYLILHEKGHYIMQVFHLKNLQSPIALGHFWVME